MSKKSYIPFTKEMKKDYKILVPDMLPIHFGLITAMLGQYGYDMEVLTNHGAHIAELGLRYVHNDTCYPAILVVGQFIDALNRGKYDPHKTALIYFQTGGGCRASNYIFLLRKALEKAGYGYVPVISLSLNGMENHPGMKLTLGISVRMIYCILYGDLIMSLRNQTLPREAEKGSCDRLVKEITDDLVKKILKPDMRFSTFEKNCRSIIERFKGLPRSEKSVVRVGIVGEIYVKFSSLGNNNLEKFLLAEGAEAVVPGLLDFVVYTVHAKITDFRLFGLNAVYYPIFKLTYRYLLSRQKRFIALTARDGFFDSPTAFDRIVQLIEPYMNTGVKMGEGWLLPAEMLELKERGVKNIICVQPFGCLPNHICGKGMMKPIKDANPDMNLVAVDYDAGATKVNQENRIKLMLACAKSADIYNNEKGTSGDSPQAQQLAAATETDGNK